MTGCHLIERKLPSEEACSCCCRNNAEKDSSPNFLLTAVVYDLMIESKSYGCHCPSSCCCFAEFVKYPYAKLLMTCLSTHSFVQALHSLIPLWSSKESIICVTGRARWISFFIIISPFHANKLSSKRIVPESHAIVAPVSRRHRLQQILTVDMSNGISFFVMVSNKGT